MMTSEPTNSTALPSSIGTMREQALDHGDVGDRPADDLAGVQLVLPLAVQPGQRAEQLGAQVVLDVQGQLPAAVAAQVQAAEAQQRRADQRDRERPDRLVRRRSGCRRLPLDQRDAGGDQCHHQRSAEREHHVASGSASSTRISRRSQPCSGRPVRVGALLPALAVLPCVLRVPRADGVVSARVRGSSFPSPSLSRLVSCLACLSLVSAPSSRSSARSTVAGSPVCTSRGASQLAYAASARSSAARPAVVSESRTTRRSPGSASRMAYPAATRPSAMAVRVGFATASRCASRVERSPPAPASLRMRYCGGVSPVCAHSTARERRMIARTAAETSAGMPAVPGVLLRTSCS